jgi:CheY-like chemotaxis protein
MDDCIGADLQPSRPLAGLRLLLVEDEALIAIEMEELIGALGAEVFGPFSRVQDALDALGHGPIHGAVLDIHLDGETSFPLADALLNRAKPVMLVTGEAEGALPEKYRRLPRLHKPLDYAEFARLAASVFER